jgi:hypothetical protein
MLTHRNLIMNVAQFLCSRGSDMRESDHVLTALPLLSTAETKCAKWRRDIVPVGLREKGCEARFIFVLPCRFIFR